MVSRQFLGGFEVLVEPTWNTTGICRCGGCGQTMSNSYTARESHRGECEELKRLEMMAERAALRAHRRRE